MKTKDVSEFLARYPFIREIFRVKDNLLAVLYFRNAERGLKPQYQQPDGRLFCPYCNTSYENGQACYCYPKVEQKEQN